MTPNESAEQKVKKVYPDACGAWDWNTHGDHYFMLYTGISFVDCIGVGDTEAEAWSDASARLVGEEKETADGN